MVIMQSREQRPAAAIENLSSPQARPDLSDQSIRNEHIGHPARSDLRTSEDQVRRRLGLIPHPADSTAYASP
jgi:hypothetical protein